MFVGLPSDVCPATRRSIPRSSSSSGSPSTRPGCPASSTGPDGEVSLTIISHTHTHTHLTLCACVYTVETVCSLRMLRSVTQCKPPHHRVCAVSGAPPQNCNFTGDSCWPDSDCSEERTGGLSTLADCLHAALHWSCTFRRFYRHPACTSTGFDDLVLHYTTLTQRLLLHYDNGPYRSHLLRRVGHCYGGPRTLNTWLHYTTCLMT